jgi:iron(III) transport system ATP-binding protein
MAVGITLNKLTKVFGSARAVDGIDLVIEPGELFFLLGPSGCGKTTLLRCIAGFNMPDSGTVHIGDIDVTRMPPHERDTGMVFQSYALWPHMSVAQNVAFGLEMRHVPKSEIQSRVAEALAMVRMTDRADAKPNQLSGGQQQRVALARALVIHPKCLLLDEPLSNLDAKLRLEMRTEIRRICKEAELTAVYVTHDQKEALSIADRIAILNDGKIQHCGSPRDVYLRPSSRFVAHFIGETNFLEGTVSSQDSGRRVVDTPIGPVTSAVAGSKSIQVGNRVTLSLRPEVVHLNHAPEGAPNVYRGSVHDSVYLGEVAQHQVTLPERSGNGEHIDMKAFELNPEIVARDEAEDADIWFEPEDVVIIPG